MLEFWRMRDRRLITTALLLAGVVLALYGRTVRHGFIGYDDSMYIYENPTVTGGLTATGFSAAFHFQAANWHPLTGC